MLIEILIILGLILLNGIFSMSEIAILSARRFKLESDAEKGDRKAQTALKLADSPNEFLSTVQIGITLIGILTGVFSGAQITDDITVFFNQFAATKPYSHVLAVFVVVFFITYFSLVLGELVPKRLGLNNAEGIAKRTAMAMQSLSRLAYPFIFLLSASTTLLLKMMGVKETDEDKITEEEIKAIIHEGTKSGEVQPVEQQIMERVFFLGDIRVISLMVPRKDIVWVNLEDDFIVNQNKIRENKHSAYPICQENIDNVLGIIHLKDVFDSNEALDNRVFGKNLRPILFVPESMSVYKLLEEFKKTKIHYACVRDEYGLLQGLVTMNDILEALVQDDNRLNIENQEIIQRDEKSWLIDAAIPFYEFLKFFELEYPEKIEEIKFHTLAGFILHHLQKIPRTGDKFQYSGYTLEVIDMDGNRIDKILVMKN
ncbi:MAG: hemolysin family protein [Microscillaceae bacterium]|jgi:putative hemolysin|nr:hemolysin family protein [Microscillaceae bacterium]